MHSPVRPLRLRPWANIYAAAQTTLAAFPPVAPDKPSCQGEEVQEEEKEESHVTTRRDG